MNPDAQLEELVTKYIEERCSLEELEELGGVLLADADARDYYLEMVLLHEHLGVLASRETLVTGGSVVPVQALIRRQRKRAFRTALLSAAAGLVLLLVVLSVVLIKPKPTMLVFREAPGTELVVTHAPREGSAIPQNGLDPGSRIDLKQGVLELKSPTGTRAVVQGPASLTLIEDGHLAFHSGTAWFQVSREDAFLRVTTPQLTVRDLGTEFGVITNAGSMPQVHVFDGKVEVEARHGIRSKEVLRAGEASEMTFVGRFSDIPVDPSSFFLELPTDLPFLHIPFEGEDGELSGISGTLPVAKHLGLSWRDPETALFSPGISGLAARFDHQESAILSDWSGPLRHRPFSVAFWMRFNVDRASGGRQCLLRWGDHTLESRSSEFILDLVSRDGASAFPRVSLDGTSYSGTSNVTDGDWHHIAVVSRGANIPVGESGVTIFVDGKPENIQIGEVPTKSRPADAVKTAAPPLGTTLLIGRDRTNGSPPQNFTGELDDLYIFEAAISPERIDRLTDR